METTTMSPRARYRGRLMGPKDMNLPDRLVRVSHRHSASGETMLYYLEYSVGGMWCVKQCFYTKFFAVRAARRLAKSYAPKPKPVNVIVWQSDKAAIPPPVTERRDMNQLLRRLLRRAA